MSKPLSIRHKKTGEIKENVKSYGFGFIDSKGAFYSANTWQIYQLREV